MKEIYKLAQILTKSILIFGIVFQALSLQAATTGDYRSAGSGNWGTLVTWERYNGSAWVTPTALQGYPGSTLNSGANVTIQNSHVVSANSVILIANTLGSLTLEGSASISFNTNGITIFATSLTMDGTSSLVGTASNNTRGITVSGTFIVPATATGVTIGNASSTNNPVVSIGGASTISGSFSTQNDGARTFIGAVTINSTGTWNTTSNTTTANLTFRGGIANSGTFTAGGATFDTNSQALSGAANMSFANAVSVNVITLTNNNTGAVFITGTGGSQLTAAVSGTWRQGANSTLNYAGSTMTTITLDATTNTPNLVNYNSTGAQVINAVNYYNLSVSNSSTATISTGITVNGNLATNNSGIFTIGAAITVGVTGSLTMDATSQVAGTATTRILNVGSFSVLSSATGASISTVALTVTNATSISGTLTMSSTQFQANGTTGVSGSLTLNTNTNTKTFIGAVTNSGTWTSTAVATGNLIFRSGVSNSGTFAAGGATFSDATSNAQSLSGNAAMSFSGVVTLSDGVTAGALVVTNSNTNTVSITGTGAAQLTGTAGAIWRQGANSTLSYAGTTIITITFDATTNTPNTVIYTNATAPTTIVNFNSLTYSGAGTLTLASPNISGDLTVSSGATFTPSGTITFNASGTTAQTIGGSGTITFASLTLNTGTGLVNVNNNISFSGTLTFSTARIMVVNSTSNVTMSSAATTFSGAASDRYIQLDGTSSAGSNLVKTTAAATSGNTSWAITYPVGTSTGGYTPVTISTIGTTPVANATLSVKPVLSSDIKNRLKRTFRLVVSGNANATTFTNGTFTYGTDPTDISSGDVETNYTTGWYLTSSSSAWGTVTLTGGVPTATGPNYTANTFTVAGGSVATASLTTGTYFYTIGASVTAQQTWYSYQTGNFADPNTWTLDPSGTTYNNPYNLYPVIGDAVEILNGTIVTMDVSGQTLTSTVIDGGAILDMVSTTSQNLGVITGTGLLKEKGPTLPAGTYTNFVATTGGTIEFYDVGGTLGTTTTTFNKLKMTNSTSSNITYILVSDMTVNSTFGISATGSGTVTWQINDDVSAVQRNITVTGDLSVSNNGAIGVGQGAPASPHLMTFQGNITNNGTIRLFNNVAGGAFLSDANWTAGTVFSTTTVVGYATQVTFSNSADQTITCNNLTYFYELVVNKGTGQSSILTINSSNSANFRLYGSANLGSSNTDGFGDGPTTTSNNALSVVNGTLQLTGFITIPILTTGGNQIPVAGATNYASYFAIPQTAGLWINGAGVDVTVAPNDKTNAAGNGDNRLLINGLFRLTNGTVTTGYSKGLNSGAAGNVLIEGGTLNTWQVRPTTTGLQNSSYVQSGGTVNVGILNLSDFGVGSPGNQYARFSIIVGTFQMSGGTLNIGTPSQNSTLANAQSIDIQSASGNYSVTGGTVNIYVPTAGFNAGINSTAPLYNLNIYKDGVGGALTAILAQPLTVSNNLTISNTNAPTLNCNSQNLTVGGNLDVQLNTTFTGFGTGPQTITFNGTGAQSWTHNGTIAALNFVTVNKASGTLTLGGSNTFPDIGATTAAATTTGGLTITSGTLDDGGKTLTVRGALSNSATHTGTGSIVLTTNLNAAAGFSPYNYTRTIGGTGGTFGNLTIATSTNAASAATSFIVTMSGNQTVSTGKTFSLNRTGANAGSSTILNIGSTSFTVLGSITSNVAIGSSYYIRTSGLYNAGGLTMKGASGDILFPVGISTTYTPNIINATATTYGTITVRPVNSEHPNVSTPSVSLKYFWRVTSSGYSGISAVTHKTYTFNNTGLIQGTPVQKQVYRSARWDASALTWATNGTTYDATVTTLIPNFNTGSGWAGVVGDQLDGEYTCGNVSAFGGVQAYYSKSSGAWNAAAGAGVWTDSPTHTGGTNLAGPPCANCPVEVGLTHTITIDADNRSCGTLSITSSATLDAASFIGLNFGTSTGGTIAGTGTLRVSAAVFPQGDFTNFIGPSGGTVEWYGTTKTIPSTYTSPVGAQNLNTYYNLILNPTAGNTITLPATGLTIYNNWTQQTGTGTVTNNGAQTLAITGNLAVSAGTFSLTNSGNTAITVGGSVTNGGTFSTVSGTHTLSVAGGITNTGTLNFNNTGTVALTFTGSSNVSFTGSGNVTLFTITVNKGSSQSPTVTFNTSGSVTTTATTTGWLTLSNGTFDFANTVGVNTNLSSQSYTIATTGKLRVSGSSVIVNTTSGDADAYDLFLNGALEVAGGTVNVGNTTVNTNGVDLEYASAGTPTINVSSGTLWVKGSIRRSTSSLTGALIYNQTGGTVTVGGIDSNTSPNRTRGVFEIDANSGSSFTMTGTSNLIVQRMTNYASNSYADLYINPISSNVSSTSTITLGLTVSGTVQANLKADIAPTIGNFVVGDGGGVSAQTVLLYSDNLVLGGSLTVPTVSTLNTRNLDVTVAGDFTCNGTYTPGANTTYFNGTGAQLATLSTTTDFNNMTISKTAGTTLTLSGSSPTAGTRNLNNLNLLSGILDVGSIILPVGRNITINSSQVGAGQILLYCTSAISNTITSSGGSFTNLNLGGAAAITKTIAVSGNLTINGTLTYSVPVRYLNIGSNQLTFGTSGTVSGASSANGFIRTNGVTSDLGITKNWGTGVGSFTYEIGTSTNYTPVTYNLNVTGTGTLNVIAVASTHPTYNQASSEQILNYYWTVTRSSSLLATATGSHTYSYPSSFITGSGGSLVAAYLDGTSNPLGWTTSGHGGTATTTQMTFTSTPTTNFPQTGNYYDYSVGTPNTLPNPITPLYSRKGLSATVGNINVGGVWNIASNWTTDTDGDLDLNNPSSVIPLGVPIVILSGSRINTNGNGRKAYKATINGYLANTTQTGHNFGTMDGTGTYRTGLGSLPAGTYTSFVSSSGGTIEYTGAVTITGLRDTYNNLKISNNVTLPSTSSMTNGTLTLNGSLTIGAGNTLDNSVNNGNITIARDWLNSGTFTAGTGTVTFNGTVAQNISGSNLFNNLTINNTLATAPQIILAADQAIGSTLTMTKGNINLNSNSLIIGTSSSSPGTLSHSLASSAGWAYGGNVTRYFNTTAIADGAVAGFFPVGTSVDFRPFFIGVPAGDMTSGGSFTLSVGSATNTTIVSIPDTGPVATILRQYQGSWSVSSSGVSGGTYDLTAGGTGFGTIGNLADLRLSKASSVVGTHQTATNTTSDPRLYRTGLSLTDVTTTDGSQFFVTSTNAVTSPLPVVLLSFTGEENTEGVGLVWRTASELNNDYFTVLHSADGESFDEIGQVKGHNTTNAPNTYNLQDYYPVLGKNYYRLKQTDLDGKTVIASTILVNVKEVKSYVKVRPNPVDKNQTLFVDLGGLTPNQFVNVQLINMQGVVVHEASAQVNGSGQVSFVYTPTDIASGLYIVRIGAFNSKVIIR